MNRLREIDFLRGIAIILVLFRHHRCFEPLHDAGWIGVDLFFVLSGYLVSKLLFKEYIANSEIKPFKFLLRRGFKIYPLFYSCILLTIFINYFFGDYLGIDNLKFEKIAAEVFFVQNYYEGLWAHTWSLAIEEHFYIGLVCIILFFIKLNALKKLIVPFCILIFFGCLGLRIANFHYNAYGHYSHLFPTHLRIDSLLFGVLLSYFHCFKENYFIQFFSKHRRFKYALSTILISTPFFFKIDSFFMNTFGLTFIYIGFGIILSMFITDPQINKKLNRLMSEKLVKYISLIGVYSYGIYLFHMFTIKYFYTILFKLEITFYYRIEFVIYFFISIFLGVFMSKTIEKPFLNLREKISPRITP